MITNYDFVISLVVNFEGKINIHYPYTRYMEDNNIDIEKFRDFLNDGITDRLIERIYNDINTHLDKGFPLESIIAIGNINHIAEFKIASDGNITGGVDSYLSNLTKMQIKIITTLFCNYAKTGVIDLDSIFG